LYVEKYYLYQTKGTQTNQKHTAMTPKEINSSRNKAGVFSAINEVAGWYAISRDGINMITFADGNSKRYTEKGFAKRITQLLNKGF
jgi:hypothetical protein